MRFEESGQESGSVHLEADIRHWNGIQFNPIKHVDLSANPFPRILDFINQNRPLISSQSLPVLPLKGLIGYFFHPEAILFTQSGGIRDSEDKGIIENK